ncbi:MAG: hypothetical protein HY543_04170 [Deltaproteobacteria bacterium]|nr:hypothetical protein [Deltaproteobacteria bacterium]
MTPPTGVSPWQCRLGATHPDDDPCLRDNPNRPIDSEAVATLPGWPQPTGWASWYARGFHGRRTAIGEVYDAYDYTIAMREKRWHGQLVAIERLDSAGQPIAGATVIARVTDWGPALHGADGTPIRGRDGRPRVADLSKAVYVALGNDPSGQLRIRITAVALQTTAGVVVPRSSSMLIDMYETDREALEKKWAILQSHPLGDQAFLRVRCHRQYYPKRVELGCFLYVDAPRYTMLDDYKAALQDAVPTDLVVMIPRTEE